MKRILVTGAYGQLGNELRLQARNYPDWFFDFTDADTLDITDEKTVEACFEKGNYNYVINCAAYTAVDKAESDEDTAYRVNAHAPRLLARYSAKAGARLIQVSTDYVFGGDAHKPYLESDPVNPQGVYGRTKLKGEEYCLEENPETIVIRTAWLYSSFGNNFVKTMLRLAEERSELGVVFDQVGSPTFAGDLAAAILKIVGCELFVPGIFHFTNEGVASWFDFAKAVFEFSAVNCRVQPVRSEQFPTPAKRPHFSVLDKAKIREIYQIEIPYWRDSLMTCLKQIKTRN